MKSKTAAFALLAAGLMSIGAAGKIEPRNLPERFRKWLQEEVVYIISPKEEDVFLQLQTDKERDLFIQAFWKERDPTPGTEENEFKTEHYRRIEYANRYFGREATGAGWRTDMGRIHIILGPPRDIENYESMNRLYPMQVWTYTGDPELGLPPSFHVAFYKRSGIGNYILYSPIKDGPASLIPGFMGDATNVAALYRYLRDVEPNVAQIALSLIPGSREQFDPYSQSFASDILVSATIPSVPLKKIETAYAEKLLRYKDIIEVEYTANYIDNDALVEVIRDPSGIFYVHYFLEPKRLSIEQYGNRYATDLEVSGMVTDADGTMIYQFERAWPLQFGAEEVEKIKGRLFGAQDMFPLVEGDYRFSLLWKNKVSKEFTSIERDIVVPGERSLRMGPLILAHKALKRAPEPGSLKPFLIEDVQLVPSPRNDFCRAEGRLYLYFQVYGLDPELRSSGAVEISILKEQEKVREKTRELPPERNADFFEEFDIGGLPPAHYAVKVAVLDREKTPRLEKEGHFFISHVPALPRPWFVSNKSAAPSDPMVANILGNQYVNKRETARALPLLEKAHRGRPEHLRYALDYARALFLAENYLQAKGVLLPYAQTDARSGELFGFLGSLDQKLGNFESAVNHYRESLKHQGTNLNILNAIGECHYRLGNTAEALVAWEKSLEINPQQEEIRNLVQSLKKN